VISIAAARVRMLAHVALAAAQQCNVFITRKFIIISHERQIQNKAESTVNKNGDLINLLVQSWICK